MHKILVFCTHVRKIYALKAACINSTSMQESKLLFRKKAVLPCIHADYEDTAWLHNLCSIALKGTNFTLGSLFLLSVG